MSLKNILMLVLACFTVARTNAALIEMRNWDVLSAEQREEAFQTARASFRQAITTCRAEVVGIDTNPYFEVSGFFCKGTGTMRIMFGRQVSWGRLGRRGVHLLTCTEDELRGIATPIIRNICHFLVAHPIHSIHAGGLQLVGEGLDEESAYHRAEAILNEIVDEASSVQQGFSIAYFSAQQPFADPIQTDYFEQFVVTPNELSFIEGTFVGQWMYEGELVSLHGQPVLVAAFGMGLDDAVFEPRGLPSDSQAEICE